jgi:hypothetical protein
MATKLIKINFSIMADALIIYVRQKASAVGGKIVYKQNGVLIEENTKTNTKKKL